MRNLLLHLDTSRHPSSFDQVVAYDGGADALMSYGSVTDADVRDLIHGCIFTRGLKELKRTAGFIGGTDVEAGQRILEAAQQAFFGPFRISLMLDSNGSNTTAVAAVEKIRSVVPELGGVRAVITAGTGPVGQRVAGLLAGAGADVAITSRTLEHGQAARAAIVARFKGQVAAHAARAPGDVGRLLEGAAILCNCGPAGVTLVSKAQWESQSALRVAVDLNAVPPPGIEGIEPNDNGVRRGHATVFGALGVGGLKMKIHKACIARLFERNDLVLDAETIDELARELTRGDARDAPPA